MRRIFDWYSASFSLFVFGRIIWFWCLIYSEQVFLIFVGYTSPYRNEGQNVLSKIYGIRIRNSMKNVLKANKIKQLNFKSTFNSKEKSLYF